MNIATQNLFKLVCYVISASHRESWLNLVEYSISETKKRQNMPNLTELSIRKMPNPLTGSKKHFDASLPGFGVRCSAKTKAFFVMYGTERRLKTLGRWPDLSLKDARQVARKLLSDAPNKQLHAPKFAYVRERFLADCATRLSPQTVQRYYFALKNLPDVKLNRVPTDVTDPNQIKALKVLFNWCIDRGLYDQNPFLRRRVKFHERDRLLTDDEICSIWHVVQPPFSEIVKLLIMTGQRRNQIWRFDPSWIQDDKLVFPPTVMKSKRPHILPLTGYKAHLPRKPITFNSWSKSKTRLDRACSVKDWVLHDFRRYFSSTMAQIGVPLHVTEQILDHKSQVAGVAAIYNRYTYLEEMRDALYLFEKHLNKIVSC